MVSKAVVFCRLREYAFVSLAASFRETVSGWVHDKARLNPREFARHSDFITTRLAAAFAPLALAPAYLALRGAPHLWEALIFVCAALPLLSVFILSRTGDLDRKSTRLNSSH